MEWISLTDEKPEGDHEYYLVTHKKNNDEWSRPEIFKWANMDWYRISHAGRQKMIAPIDPPKERG